MQEEIRSRLPKYRAAKQPVVQSNPLLQLHGGMPHPGARPQMATPPMIRPGMGPPPPNMGPPGPNIVRPGMGPPAGMPMMLPRPNFGTPPQIH